MSTTREQDRRIEMAILQIERWRKREEEERRATEALGDYVPVPSRKKKLRILTRVSPLEFAERFAFVMVFLGCMDASALHFLGTDPLADLLGMDGAHVFWAVVLASGLYLLGMFREMFKTTWRFVERKEEEK